LIASFGGRNVSYCYAHDTAAYMSLLRRNFTFPAGDDEAIAQASVFARVRNVQDVHIHGFVSYPYPRDTKLVSFGLFGLSENLRIDGCSFLFRANATFSEFAPVAIGLVGINLRDTDVNVTGGGQTAAGLVLRLTGTETSVLRNLRMGEPVEENSKANWIIYSLAGPGAGLVLDAAGPLVIESSRIFGNVSTIESYVAAMLVLRGTSVTLRDTKYCVQRLLGS